MKKPLDLSKKSFAIYGLGATGVSVIKYFKKVGIKNYILWDDNIKLKKKWRINKIREKNFKKQINSIDHIVLSPGVNIKKAKLRKALLKNKSKIITDLDLFYITNPSIRSIVVTGTNGKSTTCKIVEHVLKKNEIKVSLGGNIGKPVLNLNPKKNQLVLIEASSFQLAHSKHVTPNFALLINITNDHLDWHGSMKNYINSKFKIFSLQKKNDFAFLNNNRLLKKYKKNKYKGKLIFINSRKYAKMRKRIKNKYLNSQSNKENINFVYALCKSLKIREKLFIKSLKSFKGYPHRYEIFLKKRNTIFINDSKATSFQASKFALQSSKNIFWIVGGKPKLKDKFNLDKLKNNIIKSYIIGNHMNSFKDQLKGKVNYKLSKTLNNAIISIFKDIQNFTKKKITILLSPASASYDQFKNFEERGNQFKKIIKNYGKKYFGEIKTKSI